MFQSNDVHNSQHISVVKIEKSMRVATLTDI